LFLFVKKKGVKFKMDPITITNGISSLIFVIICIIVGALILRNYFKFGNRDFLYVGVAWIGLGSPWWSSSLSFLVALFNEVGIIDQLYLFIGTFFLPIFILLWLLAMEDLIRFGTKHIIPIIFTICSIVFEIIFLFFLFTDYTKLGKMVGPVDVSFSLLIILYQAISLLLFFITGFIFAIQSVKSKEPSINLKGKFLIIALVSFTIGTVFDILATNPLTRGILVISAIIFYFGYILPPGIKKVFIK